MSLMFTETFVCKKSHSQFWIIIVVFNSIPIKKNILKEIVKLHNYPYFQCNHHVKKMGYRKIIFADESLRFDFQIAAGWDNRACCLDRTRYLYPSPSGCNYQCHHRLSSHFFGCSWRILGSFLCFSYSDIYWSIISGHICYFHSNVLDNRGYCDNYR